MWRNIFKKCEACIDAGIQQFEASLKLGKLNCRGERDCKCLLDEDFICSNTFMVATLLRDKENIPKKCTVYFTRE
jgi:hypothetical protein